MKEYDYIVFIGRFQPFHKGHEAVIEKARRMARRKVIVLAGSSSQPRTPKNPWTFEERQSMVMSVFPDVVVSPLKDRLYNDQQWARDIQGCVMEAVYQDQGTHWFDKTPSIGLIGHEKDESSYYLRMFPQWGLIDHEMDEAIDATEIRRVIFEERSPLLIKAAVSPTVYVFLTTFAKGPDCAYLRGEYEFIRKYRESWKGTPHPVTFMTVDAVVVQSGHILMVRRKSAPGEGLLALPGGFVNQNETCEAAMLRELSEETRIKVPEKVLRGSIKSSRLFDAPGRSQRGRTFTNAYLIELEPGELPKVKGGGDAKSASWIALSDLKEVVIYEDHYHIINHLLGQV